MLPTNATRWGSTPHTLMLIGALLSLAALHLGAQDSSLVPGSWVRVAVPSASGDGTTRYTGSLRSLRGDSLIMETTPGRVDTILLRPDIRFERWSGSHSNGGLFFPGMLLGYVYGAVSAGSDEAELGGIVGALGGALLGIVVGANVHTDVWAPVSGDGLRIGLAPTRGGLQASLHWNFGRARTHP